ncbi:MAG TPA: DUF3794 domain-containing protein [Firmicutes bacterium]|nr:DUF3794 domain-containing protein [Bacillota bacterium]
MSLSVREDRLVAVNRIGENTLQSVLQGTVELPGEAAPVERIVWVKAVPTVESYTADQDRVYIQGVIDLAMVYVPETLEGEPAGLRRVEWPGALPFDHHVEVIGAEPDMICEAEASVLVCEWDLRGGQYSLDVELILASTARVFQRQEYLVISDVNAAKPVKLSADGLVLRPLSRGLELEVHKDVSGILELPEDAPSINTILDLGAVLRVTAHQVKEGAVTLEGMADLELIYEARDFAVHQLTLANALPFEAIFEKKAIKPEMALKHSLRQVCEGYAVNDGRGLRAELGVRGLLRLEKPQAVQVLTEITAAGGEVQVRKEVIGLESFVNEKEQQGLVRGLIEIDQRFPPLRELLSCRATAHWTDYEVDDDRLALEGVLDVELYYLAHSEDDVKPLYRAVFPEALSFQHTVVVPGLEPGMQPQIKLSVSQIQPDLINRETVEVALMVRSAVTATEYLELEVAVEAVQVAPAGDDPPTLTYVFVQPGDSIWKLARQYHTTEEEIFRSNPKLQDDPGLLKPGDRLQIPRR